MKDQSKTKQALIQELASLRLRIAALEQSESERRQVEKVLRESEEKYRLIFEYSPLGLLSFDEKGDIVACNDNMVQIIGSSREKLIGLNMLNLPDKNIVSAVQTALDGGHGSYEGIYSSVTAKKNTPVRCLFTPMKVGGGGLIRGVGIIEDITERKRAEDELNRVNRALRMLSDTNQALIHIADEATLLSETCRIVVEVGGYRMAWIGLAENDEAKTVRPVAHAGFESGYIESVNVTWADNERGRGPGGTAIRTGQPSIACNILVDPAFASWREAALERGYKSNIALPLIGEGHAFGELSIYSVEADAFDDREVEILKELADDLAFGITALRTRVQRDQAEVVLRESEERFRRIFDEGHFGMSLESPDHTIITANKVLCKLLGYAKQELAGKSVADITCEEDRVKSKEVLQQLFANSIPVIRMEKRYIKKDGGILWANTTITAVHGQEGNVLYALALIEDLTEKRKLADKIRLLAYYDSLTGLPNRTFHKELMKRAIEHARRHKEIFALIYIGLDNFQRINDSLGHSTGDILLKAVADRLTNALRKSDLVARANSGHSNGDILLKAVADRPANPLLKTDLVARQNKSEIVNVVSRVGGDEFIVLVHDLNQAQDAAKTVRCLLAEISAPYDLNGREIFLTVSIGISLYPDDGTDVDDLLKNAEKAMRHTKSEGKNNYHFYSSSMHSSVLALMTLENDLHKALERNELVLYYQPKVDAATRMIKGMEALIRWIHPDKGLIQPIQFIPLAETSGLIMPIGEFVIRTVCRQIKTWQEAGCKQMAVSFNVSGIQFDQQNLIEIVKDALRQTMIPSQCLDLEITESVLMRNPEKAIRILTELETMGIGIMIDDFGTGYSSLSYLKRLPALDFLKIDQSFVKSLASDPRDQAIVKATIGMAHSLNLKTIAEGVETQEQLSFLQEHGCDEIQGYLFSRPLPAEDIPGILAKGYL